MTTDDDETPRGWSGERHAPGAETEFEDEEPGSYLRELNLGPGLIVWSAINLLCAPGVVVAVLVLDPRGVDLTPWRVIWHLAPVSSALLGATALWYASSRMTRPAPRALAFAFISCALCFAAYLCGTCFASSHPVFAPPGAP